MLRVLLLVSHLRRMLAACSFQNGDWQWNLSPLTRSPDEADWMLTTDLYNYNINVCANTATNMNCRVSNPAYYFIWAGTCIITGSLDRMSWALLNPSAPTQGVALKYISEEPCQGAFREIIVNFICKEGTIGGPTQLSTPTGCLSVMDFETMYGCPKKASSGLGAGGLSIGSILLIILLCLSVVYLGAGLWYNIQYKHERFGVDALPHKEFWSAIPGLVKDGAVFSFQKAKGIYENYRGRSGEYQKI